MLFVLLAGLLAQAPPPAFTVTVEPRVETLRYRFSNPSRFDTTELVPHFFEQTYDTDNLWLGAIARYSVRRFGAETHAAFTPQVTAQADDFDTFFQPDGNVVISGTTGNASLRAWQVSQRLVTGEAGGFSFGAGYAYRRDSARYHEGTRITTMTAPPSESRELVTTREFVTSQIHRVDWFGRWAPPSKAFALTLEASPFVFSRLAVDLPDKYPGRTIRFNARGGMVAAEAAWRGGVAAMRVELAARASRSIPYSADAALHTRAVGLVLRVGTR